MIRYPVYFVNHEMHEWLDLIALHEVPPASVFGKRFESGHDSWVTQTYFELKRHGCDVHMADRMVPNAMNVVHYDDIHLREHPIDSFIIACRPDRPEAFVAHMRVVQNKLAVHRPTDYFMPHWPQPGLLPRNPLRRTRVQNVAFNGRDYNQCIEFRDDAFRKALADMDMQLIDGNAYFNDYRQVDVVLAVRPGTRYDIDLKPATKLQNAWLAGCPALLGAESGYQQLRESELDYIEVTTPDEALEALKRLKKDPDLYMAMVENGARRGRAYDRDATAKRWIEFLDGPASKEFERWQQKRQSLVWLAEGPAFVMRSIEHKLARYVHQWRI